MSEGLAELGRQCAGRDIPACATLMRAYATGEGSVRADPAKRCYYGRKTCDLGAPFACHDVCENCSRYPGPRSDHCEVATESPVPAEPVACTQPEPSSQG